MLGASQKLHQVVCLSQNECFLLIQQTVSISHLQKYTQLKKRLDKVRVRKRVLAGIVMHILFSRYIDPTAQQEKNAIKETISRMT